HGLRIYRATDCSGKLGLYFHDWSSGGFGLLVRLLTANPHDLHHQHKVGEFWAIRYSAGCRVRNHPPANGADLADQTLLNFNDTTPAPPSGFTNVLWQSDSSGDLSAYAAATQFQMFVQA